MLDRFLMPALGSVPVADVKAGDVLTALRRIQDKGRIETAHRVRALASRILRYGVAIGRAERNPVADLVGALPTPEATHFVLSCSPARPSESSGAPPLRFVRTARRCPGRSGSD
jgi:integrase